MINVLDLAKKHIELKKVASTKGGEYAGPCPGCGGQDRFRVWPKEKKGEGSYWCRQCGQSGDAIQFLRDFEGLTFRQACERLKKPLTYSHNQPRFKQTAEKPWEPRRDTIPEGLADPGLWRKKAMGFALRAWDHLFKTQTVVNYLKNRGIQEENALRFHLGWNPGENNKDIYRPRESWGLSKIADEKGGRRRLWLPIGMVIPFSVGDKIQRIRIRRAEPVEWGPNYYVVPGSSSVPMVTSDEKDVFVVVESELDAILLAQEGHELSVGALALGSAMSKPDEHATRILRECLHILVALDFDQAGARAWNWWRLNFPDCVRWPVPKGKDPGEAYQAGVDIRAWIKAGLPPGMR